MSPRKSSVSKKINNRVSMSSEVMDKSRFCGLKIEVEIDKMVVKSCTTG